MLDQYERRLYYYDVSVVSAPVGVKVYSTDEIIGRLKSVIKAGKTIQTARDATKQYWVAATDESVDGLMCLLFNYSDVNVADPVFSNMETLKLRPARKEKGEGGSFSCHLALSIEKSSTHAIMVAEGVPYFKRTSLVRYINWLLKRSWHDDYIDSNGNPKKCYPAIDLSHLMKDELCENLKGGVFECFEVVKLSEIEELDSKKEFRAERQTVVLKSQRRPQYGDVMDWIRRMLPILKKKKCARLVVKVKDSHGQIKKSLLDINSELESEVLFAKFDLIRLSEGVDQCVENIVLQVRDELYKRINCECG